MSSKSEDEVDIVGVDLLYQMDIEDIIALRNYFFPITASEDWLRDNPQGLSLSKCEFITAMDSIAGSCVLSLCAAKLFDTLDIDGSGLLQWEEVLDAIIEKTGVSRQNADESCAPISKYSVTCIPHCKGESIVKLVPLETEATFCYAIVSKLGRVGVYDGSFKLLDSYRLGLRPDEEAVRDFNEYNSDETKGGDRRRSISTFLTDAIFISDTYALLFAVSDRSLHLYDATGLVHVPLCHIIAMPNVPVCLAYHASTLDKPGLLFIGDDHGNITVMQFHQARNTLLKKKHPDKLDIFYWMELAAQSEYVTYKIHKKIHESAIKQLCFRADNDTILSCSRDSQRTLVFRHIDGKREPYLFKLQMGITCFDENRFLGHTHVLATGSNDGIVRIWNPVVTQHPLSELRGHSSPVSDLRIIRLVAGVLSLEASGVLKVWDIRNEFCLMTLPLNFPVLKVPGKQVIYGTRSIFPGALRTQIINDNQSAKSSNKPEAEQATTTGSGSNLDETQTDTCNLKASDDREWTRDTVIVSCCNYVATIHIRPPMLATSKDNDEQLPSILPPPTKEHYASAPSPWRVGESVQAVDTPRGSITSKSTKSTDSSSTSLPLKGKEAVAASAPVKDMHKRRAQHRIKQQQMQMLVDEAAPHLALDLHLLQPIRFSQPLPVPTYMKDRGVDISDPERLLRLRIHRDSSAVSRGVIGGGGHSNSSVKSSKSSKSLPATRRHTATVKGNITPNWFSEAVLALNRESTKEDVCSSSFKVTQS